jgi:hypothetical protein
MERAPQACIQHQMRAVAVFVGPQQAHDVGVLVLRKMFRPQSGSVVFHDEKCANWTARVWHGATENGP